jgi:hypothetical protein
MKMEKDRVRDIPRRKFLEMSLKVSRYSQFHQYDRK